MITYGMCQRRTGYDRMQKNKLWLMSMFEAKHQNGYANVAWIMVKWIMRKGVGSQKDSMICYGQLIIKIAKKMRLLTDEVLNSLSAPTYCRALDTTTFRELITSKERLISMDPAPGVPRVAISRGPIPSMQDLYDQVGSMEIHHEAIEKMAYMQEIITHLDMISSSISIIISSTSSSRMIRSRERKEKTCTKSDCNNDGSSGEADNVDKNAASGNVNGISSFASLVWPNSANSKVSSVNGISQRKEGSFASLLSPKEVTIKLHFRTLVNKEKVECSDCVLPKAAANLVKSRYENSIVGFFVGKDPSFPVVQNYVSNTWSKFGFKKVIRNDNGVYLFKFASKAGLEQVLE
ncbi:reverse transcriptase domain-containing protein, partial [Tanacetum coccineum]